MATDFDLESLLNARRGQRLGGEIEWFESIDSTSTRARELARRGAGEGLCVIADQQTAGRGRLGRSWASPAGRNLYISIVLRPAVALEVVPQLTLVAGLSAARAATELVPETRIKWPNDLLVRGRKVAGLLTEMEATPGSVDFVILGIGVNLNLRPDDLPEELRDKAAGLISFREGQSAIDRAAFAGRLLTHLQSDYDVFVREGFASLREAWNARSTLTGRRVDVDSSGQRTVGVVEGLAEDGTLRLRTDDGREARIVAGDVTIVDGYGR